MQRIGHSTPNAALGYQHATEERDREIATALDKMIRKEKARRLGLPTDAPPADDTAA